jgi:DNA polymerase-3 subunit gamma/tau
LATVAASGLSSYGSKVDPVDAPLALYRRYRPDTFGDVIGQEHVTAPLSHALDNNRVHHAYLFSGPRGCGKTTSARIMARALNCEKGPTSQPCGTCESCVELARGGPGSIDVIEIDAASHGGVDDARELRERAFFSPMKSRYKVYIIDEAHMVSSQGFNALLKLVEEPPSHLRFIFATTEPDKVIGTIRSRTHHYPFRLVPPKILGDYVVELSSREGVAIEQTAVPLVVRAGAGSVRDSLSVLDQLIGGSGDDGVTYELAVALLGYTPDSLLDETIDAMAAGDGATVFGVIDKVVDTGQDPRRFAEDLLQRLRDLVVVRAVPDAASRGLIELSDDQAERLGGQAQRFGGAELTRAADIVSQGLTDMRGATAPRLLLELMCARVLLPGADDSVEGLGARIDRLERRMSVVGGGSAGTPTPSRPAAAAAAPEAPPVSAPPDAAAAPAPAPVVEPGAPLAVASPSAEEPASELPSPAAELQNQTPAASESVPEPVSEPAAPAEGQPGGPSSLNLVDVRQLWPGVLDRVAKMKRMTWMLLSGSAQVRDVHDGILTVAFTEGARKNFLASGHDEILRQALIDELGVAWKIEAIIDESIGKGPRSSGRDSGSPAPTRSPAAAPAPVETAAVVEPATPTAPPHWAVGPDDSAGAGPTEGPAGPDPDVIPEDSVAAPKAAPTAAAPAAKDAIRRTRSGRDADSTGTDESPEIGDDDDVIDDATVSGHELLARELGAEVIDDIRHDR